MFNRQKKIYLDYAATTPVNPKVFEAMKSYFIKEFYNPNSLYNGAVLAKRGVDNARKLVAKELSCTEKEVIFCDGGTEANNIAIQGIIKSYIKSHPNTRPHIITSNIEHSSISNIFSQFKDQCDIDYIDVDTYGIISQKDLKNKITEKTVLIALSYANGEIGSIEDIKMLSKNVRYYRKHNNTEYPYIHCDAVAAASSLNLNVLQLGIDTMTIAGSKIYGPKKIASLYIKKNVQISPILFGGDQELELCPGTVNVPSVVGFALALKIIRNRITKETQRLKLLKKYFISEIETIPYIIINTPANSLCNIINFTIPNISSEEIILRLDAKGIACSARSACTSKSEGDSKVILAIRKTDQEHKNDTGSIRFSLGNSTRKSDIIYTIKCLKKIIKDITNVKNTIMYK